MSYVLAPLIATDLNVLIDFDRGGFTFSFFLFFFLQDIFAPLIATDLNVLIDFDRGGFTFSFFLFFFLLDIFEPLIKKINCGYIQITSSNS